MADKKISQLTSATIPLTGTEALPIVQGTTTVKVANNDLRPKQIQSNATSGVLQVNGPTDATTRVMTTPDANFTVARTDAANSFIADQTLATGNLVIGTAGKGIDFSATAGTGTSELLADYEEGTWTPTFEGGTTNPTISAYAAREGSYTKIGDLLFISFRISISGGSISGGSGDTVISGLPYAINNGTTYTVQYIPMGYNYLNGTEYTTGAGGGPRWQASGTATTKLSNYTKGNGVWGTAFYEFTGTGVFKIA